MQTHAEQQNAIENLDPTVLFPICMCSFRIFDLSFQSLVLGEFIASWSGALTGIIRGFPPLSVTH